MCIPACASDPCQNGGVCVDGNGDDYTCECKEGFEGDNCEDKIPGITHNFCWFGVSYCVLCHF